MTPVLRLHGLGAVVEVRCAGRAALTLKAALRQAWSRCLVGEDCAADGERGPVAPKVFEASLDDEEYLPRALMTTTQVVTRSLIRAQAGRLLMLHAGAVSHPATGASLVYVAPGGTGKTTLSRLLGRRFGYLTDETVGVDEAGAILPYPKPLSLRRPDAVGLKDEVSPDDLGLLPAPPAAHVERMVVLVRDAVRGSADMEELSVMDAVFADSDLRL
mgnify:CR=1 FL=1|jgi:hypothetical protein